MQKPRALARVCVLKRSVLQLPWSTNINQGVFFYKNMSNGKLYHQSHCTYICKYHIVWTCKYRGKLLANKYIKQELKRIFRVICRWKGFQVHAWHVGDDHIHLYVSIPPKFSVAYAMSVIKGKSSAWIKKKTKKFPMGSLWSAGYYVSTIGISEFAVVNYVEDQRHHQMEMVQGRLGFLSRR